MNRPLHDADDETLLAELGVVLRDRSEPPPEVVEAAKALFAWRAIDAELAALTYDSLLDDLPSLARAAAQPRILTFEADGLTVEVEVDAGPSGRRLLGQLVPAQAAELELRHEGDQNLRGTADDLGRFTLPLPADVRIVEVRCRLQVGTVVSALVEI